MGNEYGNFCMRCSNMQLEESGFLLVYEVNILIAGLPFELTKTILPGGFLSFKLATMKYLGMSPITSNLHIPVISSVDDPPAMTRFSSLALTFFSSLVIAAIYSSRSIGFPPCPLFFPSNVSLKVAIAFLISLFIICIELLCACFLMCKACNYRGLLPSPLFGYLGISTLTLNLSVLGSTCMVDLSLLFIGYW